MALPFRREQFFDLFAAYNDAIWPFQLVLLALALACVGAAFAGRARIACAILAFFWAWTALAYHVAFFTRINPAAWLFAALSLAGAGAFAWYAYRGGLELDRPSGVRRVVVLVLVLYALVVYPAIGALAGHLYPRAPTFGLPCPTTIFTAGVLLTARRLRVGAVLAPVVWSAIGSSAAFALGVVQDLGLLVAATTLLVALVVQRRSPGVALASGAGGGSS